MSKNPLSSKPNKEPNEYLKYTGLAFELLGILLICVGGGYKLDQWVETKTPWFTVAGSFIAVFGIIYYLLKKVN